jgi:hypothetical protein
LQQAFLSVFIFALIHIPKKLLVTAFTLNMQFLLMALMKQAVTTHQSSLLRLTKSKKIMMKNLTVETL